MYTEEVKQSNEDIPGELQRGSCRFLSQSVLHGLCVYVSLKMSKQ